VCFGFIPWLGSASRNPVKMMNQQNLNYLKTLDGLEEWTLSNAMQRVAKHGIYHLMHYVNIVMFFMKSDLYILLIPETKRLIRQSWGFEELWI
jgi:hypothetical protein